MQEKLLSKIKEMKGNLLVIGIADEKIIKAIETNDDITICNFLDSNAGKGIKSKKRGKRVNIKKIRRIFKRKTVDYIICDINVMSKYFRYFIKDSIYLCKKEVIYIGNTSDYDLDILISRYKRYKVLTELKKYKEKFLLIISTDQAKNNKIKDIFYFLGDTAIEIGNYITIFLTR